MTHTSNNYTFVWREELTIKKFPEYITIYNKRPKIHSEHTSNLNIARDPPKMDDAKCNQKRMDTPEESRPPK